MFGFDSEVEFALLNNHLVVAASSLVECIWRNCAVLLIAAVAFFGSVADARAQAYFELIANSEDVTFQSDRYWYGAATSNDNRYSPRIARGDGVHVFQPSALTFAQKTPAPAEDTDVLILPAPANAPPATPATPVTPMDTPAAPVEGPMVTSPKEPNGGLPTPPQETAMTELEKEFKKIDEAEKKEAEAKKEEKKDEKKEKPAIPDLARAILIAQNDGDLTFKPGVRIQPRFAHDSGNGNSDFFLRRFRLKGSGSAYGVAKYGVELREDNEERFFTIPAARVENAWLDFPTASDHVFIRAGLYDVPFSRDALTSDSKLLFMDRSLIKEQLTLVGMADNGDGIMFHGRPYGGRYEYAFGVFDSDRFELAGVAGTRDSDQLMPAGRFVVNLLDPMTPPDGYADYMQSYLGKGERLEIGANVAHLGHAEEDLIELGVTAWGVDIFANYSHYTFQAEYDQIYEDVIAGPNRFSDGWYVQFGYLFDPCDPCLEFAVRHEFLDPLDPLFDENLRWTRVGFNLYIREHNLKIQADYCFRGGNQFVNPLPFGLGNFDEDVIEFQLQLDF
jgi:hypothetical protein